MELHKEKIPVRKKLQIKYELKEIKNESPNNLIKRCVKILENNKGFRQAHELINNEFKKELIGKEYTNTAVYITGNGVKWAKALLSL